MSDAVMRIPKVRQDLYNKLGREPENCDPCCTTVSGTRNLKLEYSLPLSCIHLGSTPYVWGVAVRFACSSVGGTVIICGVGIEYDQSSLPLGSRRDDFTDRPPSLAHLPDPLSSVDSPSNPLFTPRRGESEARYFSRFYSVPVLAL